MLLIKGIVHLKFKVCHHLDTLKLFQTFINLFLLLHKRIYFEECQ